MPYLAGGSVVVAVVVAATFAVGASAAPKPDAAETAAAAAPGFSVQLAAADAKSSLTVESAAIAARSAEIKFAAAESAAAAAVAARAAAEAATARNLAGSESNTLRADGVPCDIYADACVSLSKQEAWLLRDGRVVYGPVRVATGRASLPTPAGNFHVWYKVVDGWSTTYDAPMPYSVFFYEGDAFHEDPVTVRSHGCVHLSLTNAEYFYHFLQYGDLVEVR
jgi:lipoprotein-anchoring transpeptidase ErfK/SrfK